MMSTEYKKMYSEVHTSPMEHVFTKCGTNIILRIWFDRVWGPFYKTIYERYNIGPWPVLKL